MSEAKLESSTCSLDELLSWMDKNFIEVRQEVFCGCIGYYAGFPYDGGHYREDSFRKLGTGSSPSEALMKAFLRENVLADSPAQPE